MKLGKAVVKIRVVILIVAFLLLIPAVLGMIFTRGGLRKGRVFLPHL